MKLKLAPVSPSFLRLARLMLALSIFFALLQVWNTRIEQNIQTPLKNPLKNILQKLTPVQNIHNSPFEPNSETVLSTIQSHRATPLETNISLEKFSRLLTLDVEDQQSLKISDTKSILQSIVTLPPQHIDVITFFSPIGTDQTLFESEIASQSALFNTSYTQIGIATRAAELQKIPGIIIVAAISSNFPSTQKAPITQAVTTEKHPTFTGKDLWEAVQAYRRSHGLPEFTQSTELCTVASIRLNEQLELGKLDNHDGFQNRSDDFFKKNPTWTNINENLASGYETATQTVEWGWDQSLGHKALIQSRDFPYACTAANRGFAVLVSGK